MLSKWAILERAVKEISTVHPCLLLKERTPSYLKAFLKVLQKHLDELERDFLLFVSCLCPPPSEKRFPGDTDTSICLRFAHRSCWLCVKRLQKGLTVLLIKVQESDKYEEDVDFSKTLLDDDVHQYFSLMCIPEQDVYHFEVNGYPLLVVTDIMHELFYEGFLRQCQDLTPLYSGHHLQYLTRQKKHGKHFKTHDEWTDPGVCPIVFNTYDQLNKMLSHMAVLQSYPVIPDDLAGTSCVTKQNESTDHYTVLKPGSDSKMRTGHPSKSRVCVPCKVDTMAIGIMDVHEQRDKFFCTCLFERGCSKPGSKSLNEDTDDDAYWELCDKASISRGTSITRMLLLDHKDLSPGIGCSCEDHIQVFQHNLTCMKDAYDMANVLVET